MTETLTPEQAESKRQQRAREVGPIVAPHKAIDIGASIERLMSYATASCMSNGDAERRKRAQEVEIRRAAISTLQSRWNAPERQLRAVQLNPGGKWGETLRWVEDQIGHGCLVGLTGTRGNGKTQIAVEAMRFATQNLRRAYYDTATGFFLRLKATFNRDSRLTEADVLDQFRVPQLLVLDELGKRSENDWENRVLFELLDRRYRDNADTILISNQDRNGFMEAVGASIASRMLETGGIIECRWPSFRK